MGTDLTLNYRSSRVPGRQQAFDIPLLGDTVPDGVKAAELVIDVGWSRRVLRFAPTPNLSYSWTWDGRDWLGRDLVGSTRVTFKVGYVYDAVYYEPEQQAQAFGAYGGVPLGARRDSLEVVLYNEQSVTLTRLDLNATSIGGWFLSEWNWYDPDAGMLIRGNGTQAAYDVPGVEPFAGSGAYGDFGDGGPALSAAMDAIEDIEVAPDGSVYLADAWNNRIRKVAPDGTITTVAGTGVGGFSGDGGSAIAAQLNNPEGLAIGPDGSIYIADGGNHRIRRVFPDGTIRTVAGSGTEGFSGDGEGAVSAQLSWPRDVAVAPDGAVYIADTVNHRIRRVETDGTIHTIAGTDNSGYTIAGDDGPARDALLYHPSALLLAPGGELFFIDSHGDVVRKIDNGGVITAAVGNDLQPDGYEAPEVLPALEASLAYTDGIAFDPSGRLCFSGRVNWSRNHPIVGIFCVGEKGELVPVVERNLRAPWNGEYARWDMLDSPWAMAAVESGFVVNDLTANRVYRVRAAGVSDRGIVDGGQLLQFAGEPGQHTRTTDTLTGVTLYSFTYDDTGRLESVTDGDGNRHSLLRDVAGRVQAFIAADGQETTFSYDANGFLTQVADPSGATYAMAYSTEGLLERFTDPNGHASTFTYDEEGRLIKDENAVGGYFGLSRREVEDGFETELVSATGLTHTYRIQRQAGGIERRVTIAADGTTELTTAQGEVSERTAYSDGMVIDRQFGPDPLYGMMRPMLARQTTATPGGLVATLDQTRTAGEIGTDGSPLWVEDTRTLNGRSTLSRYDRDTNTLVHTSPEGRTSATAYNDRGHIARIDGAGLLAVDLAYRQDGKLQAITQGERTYGFAYGQGGYLAALTDPLGRENRYRHDAVGRLLEETHPDGRSVRYAYDPKGNLTALIPPGREAHLFSYTAIDQEAQYTPPALEGVDTVTRYTYDLDKHLTSVVRPDGRTVALHYDSGGRLSRMNYSRGELRYGYDAQTGQLSTITTPEGGTLSLSWDGTLPTGEAWSGEIDGSVDRHYDNNFWLTGLSVNGEAMSFAYDDDGLLTAAGAMTLIRDPAHGLMTGTSLGVIETERSYNGFGELEREAVESNGSVLLETLYVRDALGRITEKRETVDGTATVYTYSYDLAGRLSQVQENGTTTATYIYDANGNRLNRASPTASETGTYDAQDRLLTYAGTSYTYTANGELASKTENGAVSQYDYDELGNLRRVTLPGDVVIDGRSRRIGKKVNGTLVQGFLYQDQLNPVAELDGSGNVVARFVYAEKSNVPAYMIKGGKTYRIVSDHLGSPRRVVDTATGEVVQRLEYDEFGRVLEDSNPGFQPFGFAGGIYDQHTGLVRFGARDYDPLTGRWTAKDPIRFTGGDTGLYSYLLADPVNGIDILGLCGPSLTQRLLNEALDRTSKDLSFRWENMVPGVVKAWLGIIALNGPSGLALATGGISVVGDSAVAYQNPTLSNQIGLGLSVVGLHDSPVGRAATAASIVQNAGK